MTFSNLRKVASIAAVSGALFVSGCQITPSPYSEETLATFAADKIQRVTANQEVVSGKITLYNAMARALKYNLDYRVEIMNSVLSRKVLGIKSYDMLPKIVANAGYSGRNNSSASYSRTLFSGVRSTDPSFSQESKSFDADVTFSWHILDFGLSYVRAKQAADEVLIAEERNRKIIHQIIEDVRTAYWRAVSADRLLAGFSSLRHRTERALKQSHSLYKSRATSPLSSLTYQRELIDIKRQIHRLERELTTAKIQLAALMNINPSSNYSLQIPKRRIPDMMIKATDEEMIAIALKNRPEMREVAYQGRINQDEAKAAILEILPGANVYAGANLDSNDFLHNSNWISYGAKVGWNLMKVFAYPARRDAVTTKDQLLDQKALATTMAIMTQVYAARARYMYLRRSAETASEYYQVQRKLSAQVKSSVLAQSASAQTLIREEMNTLVASVQYDIAYADLQNAFAAVYASVGSDPFDENISTSMSVSELSEVLKTTWRNRGDSHL